MQFEHKPVAPARQNATGGIYSTRTSTFATGAKGFAATLRRGSGFAPPGTLLAKKTVAAKKMNVNIKAGEKTSPEYVQARPSKNLSSATKILNNIGADSNSPGPFRISQKISIASDVFRGSEASTAARVSGDSASGRISGDSASSRISKGRVSCGTNLSVKSSRTSGRASSAPRTSDVSSPRTTHSGRETTSRVSFAPRYDVPAGTRATYARLTQSRSVNVFGLGEDGECVLSKGVGVDSPSTNDALSTTARRGSTQSSSVTRRSSSLKKKEAPPATISCTPPTPSTAATPPQSARKTPQKSAWYDAGYETTYIDGAHTPIVIKCSNCGAPNLRRSIY